MSEFPLPQQASLVSLLHILNFLSMPTSIYTLRPKPGKTWLQLLNEWKSRASADIDWIDEQRADDSYNFHSTPIREYEALNDHEFYTHCA